MGGYGILQFAVGRDPAWLNRGDIRADDFALGVLVGEIANSQVVRTESFVEQQPNSHSPYTCKDVRITAIRHVMRCLHLPVPVPISRAF